MNKVIVALVLSVGFLFSSASAMASKHALTCQTVYVLGGTVTTCK